MRLIDADALCFASMLERIDQHFAEDAVNEAPTVDAEPVRHGKWIGTEFDGYADGVPVYYEWKCSACGCIVEEEEPTWIFCPNCGAKMDGE